MKKEITRQNDYIIYQIDENEIPRAVEFVVKTNYNKHYIMIDDKQLELEIAEMVKTERNIFKCSCFYMVTTIDGQIVGTMRVSTVDIHDVCLPDSIDHSSINKIYHIGRFAIKQNSYEKLGCGLFKRMILLAFSHICQNRNNILIAECDMKLHRVLVRMGIDIIKLGTPFFCLGSQTISVYAPYSSIIKYYSKYNCYNNNNVNV